MLAWKWVGDKMEHMRRAFSREEGNRRRKFSQASSHARASGRRWSNGAERRRTNNATLPNSRSRQTDLRQVERPRQRSSERPWPLLNPVEPPTASAACAALIVLASARSAIERAT
jgi:hypothetical protein